MSAGKLLVVVVVGVVLAFALIRGIEGATRSTSAPAAPVIVYPQPQALPPATPVQCPAPPC